MGKHLKYEDLIVMETLLNEDYSQVEISVRISRGVSVVSRCISQNKDEDGVFRAQSAWEKIYERKRKANSHPRILSDSLLEEFIIEKIEAFWSPEQIAGKWKADTGEALCHETIYKWLKENRCDLISVKLRRSGKRYRKKRSKPEFEVAKRSIDERPKEVEARLDLGNWEGDTMFGVNPSN